MDKDSEVLIKDTEIKDGLPFSNKYMQIDKYIPIDWTIRLESLKLAYEVGKQRGFGKDLYNDIDEVFEVADMNLSYLMRK
jgi:hypothetical protein